MISKVQGQKARLPPVSQSKILLGKAMRICLMLSVATFQRYRQSYVVETGVVWFAKLKIFGSLSGRLQEKKKKCQLIVRRIFSNSRIDKEQYVSKEKRKSGINIQLVIQQETFHCIIFCIKNRDHPILLLGQRVLVFSSFPMPVHLNTPGTVLNWTGA